MHIPHLISVMVLAGVFVTMLGSGGARAESQAGGVPAVSDRLTVLERATATLRTTVTTLQTQVTTLRTTVTTLQTDNTDLKGALAAEIAAREASENALRAADDDIRGVVFQLALDRLKGDLDLATRISNVEALIGAGASGKFFDVRTSGGLVHGGRATVATLGPLPPGNYLVIGRVDVENFIHDTLWFCSLHDPLHQGPDFSVDAASTSTQSVGFTGSALSSLTMAGIARLTTSGPVTIECQSTESGSDLPGIHLLAVQVGQPG